MKSTAQIVSLVVTTLGLVASAVLAVKLVQARQTDAGVQDALSSASTLAAQASRRRVELGAEVEELGRQAEERRVRMLMSLPAAQRARVMVEPLVARMKADHAAHPRPRRPLPIPPIVPSRMLPPELRDDPVYLRSEFMGRRRWFDERFRERVSAAALPDASVERALDLLTEHAMVVDDLLSVAQKPSGSVDAGVMDVARTQKAEIAETLRVLVGDQTYKTLLAPTRTFDFDPVTQRQTWRMEKALGVTPGGEWRLGALSTRLSYSEVPLSDEQRQSMIAECDRAELAGENLLARDGRLAPAFVAIVKASLRPEQLSALAELEAEAQAVEKRRRLPKVETTPAKR